MQSPNPRYTEGEIRRQMMAAKFLLQSLENEELDDDFKHDVVLGETNFFEAIEVALDEIRDCEIMEVGLKAKIDQLESRKRRAKNRREKLRGLIEQAMATADIKSHVFPAETLTLKAVKGKLQITDETAIPSMFWVSGPPKLDTAKLAETIKLTKVAGAEIGNGGISLQIRKS